MSNTTPPYPLPPGDQQQPQPGQYQPGNTHQPQQMPLEPKYNVLAIISLVSAFVISLAAIITGHIALSQIKKTGEKGRGLALAGVILGYIGIVAGAVAILVMITVGMSAGQAAIDIAERQQDAVATQEASAGADERTAPVTDGTVTPEVCAAFAGAQGAMEAATTANERGEVGMELYKQLGEAPGPFQATYSVAYEEMNELILTNPEATELPESVLIAQEQLLLDAAACNSQIIQ